MQSKNQAFHTDPVSEAKLIALAHGNRRDALLEILHDLQDRIGYVPDEAVPAIAEAINISRAEVHGVITFYHDFHQHPVGRHMIKVCQAEACQSMGCRQLAAHAERKLGTKFGGTTADGKITIEAVYCLGNCALSPAVMIDGDLHGRVSPARFDELVGALERETAQ